ncbi:hypothetical protein I0C86_01910 [Plantactinospora sp. S1510]|uniref:Uncharacterized protein n=1 Tax=Plantactinospora alkalitolerans TaxID=2789879 RepID=A0ABS0GNJ5_9ACTN|nr:hypothetical protein [Plantactinospora alkalitolerans]MBF9127758.1 hypothetical protein [Plantactinospora alkalitolerans]
MNYDLRDVLDSATAEAPPPRLTADDAIAAGRSLQRRRRYGWTGGVAAVAALAVAGVMSAPYLSGAAGPAETGPAAGPAEAAPVAEPVTFPTLAKPFMYSIKGYSVGPLHVSDPVFATAAYQESILTLDGVERQKVTNSAGTWERSYDRSVGTLTVYRPGVFKPDRFTSGTPVRVDDLPGLQTEFDKEVSEVRVENGRKNFSSRTVRVAALAWQYADGAWATLVANQLLRTADPAKDLLALADGLTPAEPSVVRVPYRLGSVPAGYRLVGIGRFNPTNAGDSISEAYFSKSAVPVTNLTDRLTEDDLMKASGSLKIIVTETAPAGPSDPNPHPNPRNPCQENFCDRAINAHYFAEISDNRNRVDVVRRVTDGLRFDNPTDPATWHDASTIGVAR